MSHNVSVFPPQSAMDVMAAISRVQQEIDAIKRVRQEREIVASSKETHVSASTEHGFGQRYAVAVPVEKGIILAQLQLAESRHREGLKAALDVIRGYADSVEV